MNQPFREKNDEKPRILVAPLDWGLGHATRCIPIIRELLAQGADTWLAGEGAQEELLKTEFPGLPFLSLPGYRVRYAKTRWGLFWKMLQQGPQLRRAIQYEHQWLKKMTAEHGFDGVISDNRYGLYHPAIPSIFLTHQLAIQSPLGKWSEKFLQKKNYRYINHFTECWVPDSEGDNNLAAALSHPVKKPAIPLRYTGVLSRFEKQDVAEKKGHLVVILSGPEPQRTILEEKIIREISTHQGSATIIRGLPGTVTLVPSTNMIRVYNHLPAAALNTAIQEAEYIISRSGYSTVMDIVTLQKKSILIPTAGQTEQEYLGHSLQERKIALCIDQEEFTLDAALETAKEFLYALPPVEKNDLLKKAIRDLLDHSLAPALG
ncbi:MAG: glycosyltransferase [Chitinophagaceae bacterium]